MKLRNKKTGKIWEVLEDDGSYFISYDDIHFIAREEDEENYIGGQYFEYSSIEALREEWEDYTPTSSYREYVEEILRKYTWEVYYESEKIYRASKGDNRHYMRNSHENTGRLDAVRDIAHALGIEIEPITKYFTEDGVWYLDPKLHDEKLYRYGFEEGE